MVGKYDLETGMERRDEALNFELVLTTAHILKGEN